MKKIILILITLISISTIAQNDTIHIKNNKLLLKKLKNEKSRYLVYIEKADGGLMNMSIWERETVLKNDKIVISQNWKSQDTVWNRYIYSVNERSNFEPIYHFSKSGKKIEAFSYGKTLVKGTDSISNNNKIGFEKKYTIKPFNWELDLEIFKTLPYKVGKTFIIYFYHPGSKSPPSFHSYKVLRKEHLKDIGKHNIECWVMEISHSKDDKTTFWISTETNDVLKMIQTFKQIKRYKIKI